MSFVLICLGKVVELVMGQAPPGKECNKNGKGVPFVKAGEFGVDRPIIREWTTKPLKMAKLNDVLLCVVGATAGKVSRGEDCAIGRSVAAIRADESKLNRDYLYYFICSWTGRLRDMSQGAAQTVINREMINNLKIPLPPLETQKQIAAVLENADQLRKDCQKMEQEFNSLAQSVFIDMFGDPLVNEKGWNVNPLDNLTTKITDGKHGDCVDEENSGYYFVSAKNIRNGKIDFFGARQINKKEFDEVHRRTDLKPGDLVMINTGATIGRLAVANSDERTQRATFQKSVAVIKPNTKVINTVFLKYVFMLRVNDFAAVGSGSAIKNLLLSKMKAFQIITPPLDYQNEFSVIEQKIQESVDLIGEEYREAESNFDSLMQGAFKGELKLKPSKAA